MYYCYWGTKNSSSAEGPTSISFKRNDPRAMKTFPGQQQKVQHLQTSAPERRQQFRQLNWYWGELRMNKYKCCSGPGKSIGVVFALQLRTVGFESIFPLKNKNTQNDNSEAQLSSLRINTSAWFWSLWSLKPYILFSSSVPPAKKLHFFPSLNKQLG